MNVAQKLERLKQSVTSDLTKTGTKTGTSDRVSDKKKDFYQHDCPKGVDAYFINHGDGTGTKVYRNASECLIAWSVQLYLRCLDSRITTKVLSNIYMVHCPNLAAVDNYRKDYIYRLACRRAGEDEDLAFNWRWNGPEHPQTQKLQALVEEHVMDTERIGYYCFDVEVAEGEVLRNSEKQEFEKNKICDEMKMKLIKMFGINSHDLCAYHFDMHQGNIMKHKNRWVIIDTGRHLLKGIETYVKYKFKVSGGDTERVCDLETTRHLHNIWDIANLANCVPPKAKEEIRHIYRNA